jgi:hypothetical protein
MFLNKYGGVAEWLKAPVLKTGDPLRGPGVRIPPPPQIQKNANDNVRVFLYSKNWYLSPNADIIFIYHYRINFKQMKPITYLLITIISLSPLSIYANEEISIPSSSRFCSQFPEIKDALTIQIVAEESDAKERELRREMSSIRRNAESEARKAKARANAEEKRIRNFDRSNIRPRTTRQREVFEEYNQKLESITLSRLEKIEELNQVYQEKASFIISQKNFQIDSHIGEYRENIKKAGDIAVENCAREIKDKDISSEFNDSLRIFKSQLNNQKRINQSVEFDIIGDQRDAGFIQASTDFKDQSEKIKAELLIQMQS